MISRGFYGAALLVFAAALASCHGERPKNARLEDIAANEEVARYMRAFEKHGEQPDGSQPVEPAKALAMFRHPDDLRLDLVLAEPDISQPVFLNFDHRGRLWVVQYNQYPYPAGLKVTSIDNHDRVTFDKTPAPPPYGVKGADKITFFEDTDGDGKYDKATDAITGLNIATSVTLGRGRIWVLSPPYLLAYPDPDGDGIPDGPPVVHLKGFGLEDTHAVANSLRWGPDGWLYGAQGSTTTANISSDSTKNVSFSGQAIWRYHPETHVFELFAEGGGNTFSIEMDRKGRVFSGDNGTARGYYFKQGGYYIKNWGKHGALTNLYAFGYLPGMGLSGDSLRFTHAWIKYEGDNLPGRYREAMIALNPLHGFVQLTRFELHGSDFNNIDEERILETNDRWFRPVDITPGPDGAVYIADWYDSRLSHIDPLDNWHKSSGRIYRLSAKAEPAARKEAREEIRKPFDLSKYSSAGLIGLLSNGDRWYREQALRQLGDRKDRSLVPGLVRLLTTDTGQTALEALWAINLSGGFDDTVARIALLHRDPYVRLWGVRLLGDARHVSPAMATLLDSVAAVEPDPEVRSQLASSAKRLPGPEAMGIIGNLLLRHEDSGDPDIPLLVWWALESKAESDRRVVLDLFDHPGIWDRPIVKQVILSRLMQRYIMAGGPENLAASVHLLDKAPTREHGKWLIAGLQEGMRGADFGEMPAALARALGPYQKEFTKESPGLALRQGGGQARRQALETIANEQAELGKRLSYIRAMGEVNMPESVPVLLRLLAHSSDNAILKASLQTLQRYNNPGTGIQVLESYPDKLRAYPDIREAALSLFASREVWAKQFLREVGNGKKIHPEDIPAEIVQRFMLLNDSTVLGAVGRLWPGARLANAAETREKIAYVARLLQSGKGDTIRGKALFSRSCGSCHRLFSEGGHIGPDLTGYERTNTGDLLLNIINPSASIREGFAYYHIVTMDGRNITGKILERQGSVLRVQPLSGEPIVMNTGQIKTMQAQASSIMPEHLLDALTDQQVRDLFSYLMKKDHR